MVASSYHTFEAVCSINPTSRPHLSSTSLDTCELQIQHPQDLFKRQDCLRRRVRYFFMDPFQKYHVKGVLPFKLFLTLLIIIFMTFQLFSFENHIYNYTQEHRDTERTLRNIFLKNWDNGDPPENYAVYTVPDFYENLDYVVLKFSQFGNINVGAFGYDSPDGGLTSMEFCHTSFQNGHIFPHNNTVRLRSDPIEECIDIPPTFPMGDARWDKFSIQEFLKTSNVTVDFTRLVSARLTFHLKLVFIMADFDHPDCYRLRVLVRYKNRKHDGQIPIRLTTSAEKQSCNISGRPSQPHDPSNYLIRQVQNFAVLVLATTLSALVIRSLYIGQKLRREMIRLFKEEYNSVLSNGDQHRFLDAWFLVVLSANACLIAGSIIKLKIEAGTSSDALYSVCSVLLGTGNLLTWLGLLRYLDFFAEYNIVIITIRRGSGVVLKGMLAALVIFIGYTVCGWLVLAPYHSKFRFLSTASETLYCIIYGDDMFPTYAELETRSLLIWYFSRIYLYSFIFIFICVILSILIAIILDVYETVKSRVTKGEDMGSKSLDDFLMVKEGETVEQLKQIYRQANTKCFCHTCRHFSLKSFFSR